MARDDCSHANHARSPNLVHRHTTVRTVESWVSMTWTPDDEAGHKREMPMSVSLATAVAGWLHDDLGSAARPLTTRRPHSSQLLAQVICEFRDRYADLFHAVAVADGYGLVRLNCIEVDGNA